MKINTKALSIISLILFSCFTLSAQILEPVEWTFSKKDLGKNKKELIFKASLDPGWHLYSQGIPSGGPVPTSFKFKDNPNVKLLGNVEENSHSIEKYEPVFEMELQYFEEEAVFSQKVKLPGKKATLEGSLEYMTCNNKQCLPPTTEAFTFNLSKNISGKASKEEYTPTKTSEKETVKKPGDKSKPANFGFTMANPADNRSQKDQLLDPVNWSYHAEKGSDQKIRLVLKAELDPGWHLYAQDIPEDGPIPTTFNFTENAAYSLAGKISPENKPIEKFDSTFEMKLRYFEDQAIFVQSIYVHEKIQSVKGSLEYMVCDNERCLPPEEKTFEINLGQSLMEKVGTVPRSPVTSTESKVENKSLWGIFAGGFLGGLIALLTPCVFPMIPLTVSFFTKQSSSRRGKGITQAALYGLSIIIIYVAIGFIITKTLGPSALNNMASSIFWNLLFFVIFIVFAASFFGAFEINLPSSWVNKMDTQSNRGGLIGIFFMAFTLALVSFSCTGPIIGTLLVEAAIHGSNSGPLAGMLGFSLALGLPFTLFAIFPAWLNKLPKSGGWMNSVKVVLGFLELALALKFLSNVDLAYHWGILTREVFIGLWITIFSLLGFYLLGKLRFLHDSELPYISVPRLFLAIISFSFVVYLIPGLWGAPLKLISGFPPPMFYREWQKPQLQRIQSSGNGQEGNREIAYNPHCPHNLNCFHDYEKGLEYAQKHEKPVILDFTGWTCVNCRKMEDKVWIEADVFTLLQNKYVLISLYVDDKTKLPESEQYVSDFSGDKITTVGKKWSDFQASRFGANSQPYYVLLNPQGQKLIPPKGYTPNPEKYERFLEKGLEVYHQRKNQTVNNL